MVLRDDLKQLADKTVVVDLDAISYKNMRWGRNLTPTWIHNVPIVAPGAGAVLVTYPVGVGLVGYIYGFFVSAQEANRFVLNWTSGGVPYAMSIVFAAPGSTECVDPAPINEGIPADAGTNITITNVTAGGAGATYQARLFIGVI